MRIDWCGYSLVSNSLAGWGAPPAHHHPKTPKGKIVTQPMSHFLVHTKTGPWVLPEAVYPSNHPSVWLACQISRPVSLISSVGDAACDLEARDREPLSLLHYCLLFRVWILCVPDGHATCRRHGHIACSLLHASSFLRVTRIILGGKFVCRIRCW